MVEAATSWWRPLPVAERSWLLGLGIVRQYAGGGHYRQPREAASWDWDYFGNLLMERATGSREKLVAGTGDSSGTCWRRPPPVAERSW
jgi:hypothetical protein